MNRKCECCGAPIPYSPCPQCRRCETEDWVFIWTLWAVAIGMIAFGG